MPLSPELIDAAFRFHDGVELYVSEVCWCDFLGVSTGRRSFPSDEVDLVSRPIIYCGEHQPCTPTALNGWEHTGENVAVFQFIVGDDHADNADPADGVVQVEPDILSLEAGTVVEGGVDVL